MGSLLQIDFGQSQKFYFQEVVSEHSLSEVMNFNLLLYKKPLRGVGARRKPSLFGVGTSPALGQEHLLWGH